MTEERALNMHHAHALLLVVAQVVGGFRYLWRRGEVGQVELLVPPLGTLEGTHQRVGLRREVVPVIAEPDDHVDEVLNERIQRHPYLVKHSPQSPVYRDAYLRLYFLVILFHCLVGFLFLLPCVCVA